MVGELVQSGPGRATRTGRHARAAPRELFKVELLAAGEGVVEQDGRRANLRPGDLALIDLTRPAKWAMSAAVRCVGILFAPAMLPLRRDELARLTAVRLPGDDGRARWPPGSRGSSRATWTTRSATSGRGSGPPRSTC